MTLPPRAVAEVPATNLAAGKVSEVSATTVGTTTFNRPISRRTALGAGTVAGSMASAVQAAATRQTAAVARGLIGDGKTDDTAGLQAALDHLYALGGGVLSLPTGNFRIEGTVHGRLGVSIKGQGSLASRLIKVGPGHCLIFGTGTRTDDLDVEHVVLERFAIIGQPDSGHMLWCRKATTAFALRDLYVEGGNGTVMLDSCYSLMMENVQVRAAETGDNIAINAISHNVLLIQVASQIAKAGAGIAIAGCYAAVIVGGKLEFNAHDQLRIEGSCRGVNVTGVYIEGIRPIATGYAGIAVRDADSVSISGGFFDATQSLGGDAMATDGTGTYVKATGKTVRLTCSGYGFPSTAPTQRHIEIGATAYGCDVTVPLGANVVNDAPVRNVVRFGAGEQGPLRVGRAVGLTVRHGETTSLAFPTIIDDIRDEWDGVDTYVPKLDGVYTVAGFVQLTKVPLGSEVGVMLEDVDARVPVARVQHGLLSGDPSIEFSFRERLIAGRRYCVGLRYHDGQQRDRALSADGTANRLTIDRMI